MAKVKVIIPKNLKKRVENNLNKSISSNDLLEGIAKSIIDEIQKGVNPKTGRPFKALKESTIKRRKSLARFNVTDSKYSARKSNVTFTADFLNSIKAVISKGRFRKTITIEPKGTHAGYNLVRGGTSKSVSNKKIAQGLEDQGRQVITISKKKIEKIRKDISKFIKRHLS